MTDRKTTTEIQTNIIDSINTLVDSKLSATNTPQNKVGVVVQDPSGYNCIVKINGTEFTCTLPEHLHDWISKDDIVIVQDLYGNGLSLTIIGSSGSTRNNTLVIHDEKLNRNISGVTKFESEDGVLSDEDIIIN
ncbi:hypothetical protein [Liquorilactobacillus hordei]|uniref:Uncharacterized protein n=1 Tax=Liquorilactobacillus hordei DSM 19519 TaxID=1423759 RepID=A0A0R1MQC4_9LACO|nr:hypothetical protein [Liquorilactobacillus hordei]KRL07940.1 hypothetical protein FC92_GL001007 [Liquorilactobacillus hordei DSM 19519]QYH51115.1 hypothetical protein G6O70_00720 [Liquorilactobacillus hordei DSM 19519]